MTGKCIAYQENGVICGKLTVWWRLWFAVAVVLISLLVFASEIKAQDSFVLDCRVTKLNPALYMLGDSPTDKAILAFLETEQYRFTIFPGRKTGLASTRRGYNLPTKVMESETQYQIDFEGKTIFIDRMNGEFKIRGQGAAGFIASGVCNRLGERKF